MIQEAPYFIYARDPVSYFYFPRGPRACRARAAKVSEANQQCHFKSSRCGMKLLCTDSCRRTVPMEPPMSNRSIDATSETYMAIRWNLWYAYNHAGGFLYYSSICKENSQDSKKFVYRNVLRKIDHRIWLRPRSSLAKKLFIEHFSNFGEGPAMGNIQNLETK